MLTRSIFMGSLSPMFLNDAISIRLVLELCGSQTTSHLVCLARFAEVPLQSVNGIRSRPVHEI
jgi:hypothetical protein